jgi:catechol 2,3-dioxygenase-like lactoylglutathione lyase family enzyme
MKLGENAKLNHLSFPTHDAAGTAAFFEKFLGCDVSAAGDHRILKRSGFDIVLEHVSEAPEWPRTFHFGLEVDSVDEVRELYQAFLDGGVQMETEVVSSPRGSRFFCRVPGGVQIEINTRADMMTQEQWQKMF